MWIFLGIVAFLAAVIAVILSLPIYVIIKSDENGELVLLYRFLGKIYGEHPDPNNPILKQLKKSSGVARIEKQGLQKSLAQQGFWATVSETCRILADLLIEIGHILKYCTAKKFEIEAVCAEEDAADTAIRYGQCCAAVYPLSGILSANMKVKKKARKIDIRCDFTSGKPSFRYDFLIMVRLGRALAALWRISLKEAKRTYENNPPVSSAPPSDQPR